MWGCLYPHTHLPHPQAKAKAAADASAKATAAADAGNTAGAEAAASAAAEASASAQGAANAASTASAKATATATSKGTADKPAAVSAVLPLPGLRGFEKCLQQHPKLLKNLWSLPGRSNDRVVLIKELA